MGTTGAQEAEQFVGFYRELSGLVPAFFSYTLQVKMWMGKILYNRKMSPTCVCVCVSEVKKMHKV